MKTKSVEIEISEYTQTNDNETFGNPSNHEINYKLVLSIVVALFHEVMYSSRTLFHKNQNIQSYIEYIMWEYVLISWLNF